MVLWKMGQSNNWPIYELTKWGRICTKASENHVHKANTQISMDICCVRWVFAVYSMLREMLKHKVSSYTKIEDPDQNGPMPTHGK